MPYIKRNDDGLLWLFETLEELESEQNGMNLVEGRPARMLTPEPKPKLSVNQINKWLPELAHLKSGDILYLKSSSALFRNLTANISYARRLVPVEERPNFLRRVDTGELYRKSWKGHYRVNDDGSPINLKAVRALGVEPDFPDVKPEPIAGKPGWLRHEATGALYCERGKYIFLVNADGTAVYPEILKMLGVDQENGFQAPSF